MATNSYQRRVRNVKKEDAWRLFRGWTGFTGWFDSQDWRGGDGAPCGWRVLRVRRPALLGCWGRRGAFGTVNARMRGDYCERQAGLG